jgi:hypothetical protein
VSTYNGHKNWNYWNVALWIGNDEGLYNLARQAIRSTRNRKAAGEYFMESLRGCGLTQTPDGAAYSAAKVIHSMRGM